MGSKKCPIVREIPPHHMVSWKYFDEQVKPLKALVWGSGRHELDKITRSKALGALLRASFLNRCKHVFEVEWRGETDVPLQIEIGGKTFSLYSHGSVVDPERNDTVGIFERVTCCGGENSRQQMVKVFIGIGLNHLNPERQ